MSDRDPANSSAVPSHVERELAARVDDILTEEAGRHTIGELAERVDEGDSLTESPADVHEALHGQVLAKLEREGKLEFDADTGIVRPVGEGSGFPWQWLGPWGNRLLSPQVLAFVALVLTAAALYLGSAPIP